MPSSSTQSLVGSKWCSWRSALDIEHTCTALAISSSLWEPVKVLTPLEVSQGGALLAFLTWSHCHYETTRPIDHSQNFPKQDTPANVKAERKRKAHKVTVIDPGTTWSWNFRDQWKTRACLPQVLITQALHAPKDLPGHQKGCNSRVRLHHRLQKNYFPASSHVCLGRFGLWVLRPLFFIFLLHSPGRSLVFL